MTRVFAYGLLVGRQDFGIFWNWKTWLAGWMFRVFCSAVAWILLGEVLGSRDTLNYLLIGHAVLLGATAPGALAAATWDRYDGTYPLLVAAPSSLVPAIVGRASIWLLNGIATSLACFAVLAGLFGLPLSLPGVLLVPFLVAIVCASAFCLHTFLAALIVRAPQLRNILNGIAATCLVAFCGASVPVSFWPGWIGAIAGVMPTTHGLYSIRLLLNHGAPLEIFQGVALEALIGLVWLTLGVLTMDRFAAAGRADGSIELV
jgi:ABC-2 type transport system permease protein